MYSKFVMDWAPSHLPLRIVASDDPSPWNFQQPSLDVCGYFLELHVNESVCTYFTYQVKHEAHGH